GNSTSPSYDLQLSRITNPVNGTIDEFRLSNVSRSADWITTEFNNQIDPSSFYVISSEKVQSEWPYPDFQYRKKITVDNTKVSGTSTLEDFPMLIDLYDYDLRTLVQPDGDDIAFTDVTGTLLDYEIELFNQTYNNTHAHLVAWVRVPSLSATINTNITMYYGNSTLSSQENVEGVWDANFKVVHHLEEDPTGTIYDSTSNNNDATSYGTMTSNDQVSGKINGALDFDGSDDYISWTTAISSTSGTYSWWMYTHSVVGERNYIADDAYRRRISLWDDVVKIETDTEAEYFDFTTSSISANTWTHIVFVRSGDVGDLYVDGMLVQQVTVPEADNLTLSGIGGTSDNTRMVDGLMDEVRISNITRSFDWIATEYNNQFVSESFYSTGNTEYGPNYQGLPVVVEWVTGEIENSNSVTTNSTILGMPDHLYIAAVSSKGYRDTTSVTGLGLTWNELEDQPSGRSATGMSVWYAIGTSTITTGTVTANITDLQQVALQVYRIAGVNTSDPIGDHESANTNGENGAGSGGIDNDSPYLDIVTTSPNATVIGMIAKRQRDYIALGTGYTFLTENQAGTSGSAAGILSVYKTVTSAGTVVVNATIETEVDWAVVGVEIKPNSQIIIDEISPTLNYFGLEDPGTGTGTFWANVSDNIAVSSVNLKINSSSYDMTFNGSLWTYQ
ncbi:MAG: DUF2341 domain-containing protein, partial [Candidatus Kariarchaeaceae archaeon]